MEEDQLRVHGYVLPEHKFIMDYDWEWALTMHHFYDHSFTRKGGLAPKMRCLCVVVALCARIPGIEGERYIQNHMGKAMEAGATPSEIVEALECLYFPCGGPSMLVGVKCLREVLSKQDTGTSSSKDAPSPQSSAEIPLPDEFESDGSETPEEKQALIEQMKTTYGPLLPEQAFLTENNWERFRRRYRLYTYRFDREGALPREMKQLLIAIATAVRMPGSESARYIKNHLRNALRLGLSKEEIIQAYESITFPTGGSTMMVGIKCLMDLLEEGADGSVS